MILLNFSHPITEEQKEEIETLMQSKIQEVKEINIYFDSDKPFEQQVEELINNLGYTREDWQTLPILIVPPALNFITATLLAALHGLMGYFPSIVRLKPDNSSGVTKFRVAEIINLQKVREKFRSKR